MMNFCLQSKSLTAAPENCNERNIPEDHLPPLEHAPSSASSLRSKHLASWQGRGQRGRLSVTLEETSVQLVLVLKLLQHLQLLATLVFYKAPNMYNSIQMPSDMRLQWFMCFYFPLACPLLSPDTLHAAAYQLRSGSQTYCKVLDLTVWHSVP